MIIKVAKNWRMKSDTNQWMVEKREKSQKTGWRPISYHQDFEGAVVSLTERRIRLIPNGFSTDEIRTAIKEIKDDAKKVIFEYGETTP